MFVDSYSHCRDTWVNWVQFALKIVFSSEMILTQSINFSRTPHESSKEVEDYKDLRVSSLNKQNF